MRRHLPQVVSRRFMQENWEAFERLKAARPDEEYMAELRGMYPNLITEECWRLEMYKKVQPMSLGRPVMTWTFAPVPPAP